MILPFFVFLKPSAWQTGYQGGGHESRLPAGRQRSALCEKLVIMPAIASLEDLKAAQKEGLLFYEGLPQAKRSSSETLLKP